MKRSCAESGHDSTDGCGARGQSDPVTGLIIAAQGGCPEIEEGAASVSTGHEPSVITPVQTGAPAPRSP